MKKIITILLLSLCFVSFQSCTEEGITLEEIGSPGGGTGGGGGGSTSGSVTFTTNDGNVSNSINILSLITSELISDNFVGHSISLTSLSETGSTLDIDLSRDDNSEDFLNYVLNQNNSEGTIYYLNASTGQQFSTAFSDNSTYQFIATDINLTDFKGSGTFNSALFDIAENDFSITNGEFTDIPIVKINQKGSITSSITFTVDGGSPNLIESSPTSIEDGKIGQYIHTESIDTNALIYQVSDNSSPYKNIFISFPKNISVGSYTIDPQTDYRVEFDNSINESFTAQSGSLEITALSATEISGTFSCIATQDNNTSNSIDVTNGSFTLQNF